MCIRDRLRAVGEALAEEHSGLIFANLVDFDMEWGHRNDAERFAAALVYLDSQLGRFLSLLEPTDALIITADHGNAEEMFELDKKTGQPKLHPDGRPKAKTAHTLNPVWFIIYDPSGTDCILFNPEVSTPGLTNVASTLLQLLGVEAPDIYDPPLLLFKKEC